MRALRASGERADSEGRWGELTCVRAVRASGEG